MGVILTKMKDFLRSRTVTCAIKVLISRSKEKVQVRDILITVQWSSNRKLCVDWMP